MAPPNMYQRPSTPQISQHGSHGSYGSHQEYYHSPQSSPPLPAPQYQEYPVSPALTHTSPRLTSTLSSTPSEQDVKERGRHFSDDSEVGYAEMTSPQPQFLHKSQTQEEQDKEAYRRSLLPPPLRPQKDAPIISERERRKQERQAHRRRCGMSMPVFWIVMGILFIAVLALALGLGLGLGLKKSKSSSTGPDESQAAQTLIGGDINPKYYSKEGAFNGSGVAIASANQGVAADLFVFWQEHTGDIVHSYFAGDGSWSFVATVATDARNATPISAVAYIYESVAITHLFYIDNDNIIRQKITSNNTQSRIYVWRDGPLNDLNLKSYDSELVGMQACYWGNYYGSSSNFNQTSYPTKSEPTTGINLFYATDNSTFAQYDWTNGHEAWNYSQSFNDMNTHAGIACQTWLTNTTQYLAMVDTTNTIRIMWRDTDVNKTSTSSHPINQWTQTSITIPDVHTSTSLGYTDFLAYQDSNSLLRGVSINWAAENSTIETMSSSSSGNSNNPNDYVAWAIDSSWAGIPGTHLAITALDTSSGGRQLAVFYQSIGGGDDGDGFTIGWRDSSPQGPWSYASVPVNSTAAS